MSGEAEKELQTVRNRLRDLAGRAYSQNRFTFSGFLGLSEQQVFAALTGELGKISWKLWGGRERSERVMIRFGSPEELGYEEDFPICCIHIRPASYKFGEEISHRDVLGALMNLGIERRLLGDIVTGDRQAYVFCRDTAADHICANLDMVRRTSVICRVTQTMEELPEEETAVLDIQVASQRLDACIAKVHHFSRTEALALFRAGRVYVDGRLCENNSRMLSVGEMVNVRGFGRFCAEEEKGVTRKGKYGLRVRIWK